MTLDEFHQTVCENICKVRVAKGIHSKALSTKIGHNETYIWRVENGYNKPTRATVAKIAEALGVSLEELLP